MTDREGSCYKVFFSAWCLIKFSKHRREDHPEADVNFRQSHVKADSCILHWLINRMPAQLQMHYCI